VWSERWRKCAEFLKELDQGLVRLHLLAHKYQGIRIPSPEAEAFAKEWAEWWKTLKHVIVLRNRDPHGALLVMRARGLLPLDCACGMELAPEWVGFLLRLYDPKCAPKCLLTDTARPALQGNGSQLRLAYGAHLLLLGACRFGIRLAGLSSDPRVGTLASEEGDNTVQGCVR